MTQNNGALHPVKQPDHFQEADTVTTLYSHLHHTRTRLNSHRTATVRCPLLAFSHLNLSRPTCHQRSPIYVDRLTYNAWPWTVRNWRQEYKETAILKMIGYNIQSDPLHENTSLVTAFGPDTHPSCLHLTSNQQELEICTVCTSSNEDNSFRNHNR
jgi:hypothetical protein